MTNKEKNAEFEALGPAEKRMAIAQDVLDLIAAQKIIARSGSWLSRTTKDDMFIGLADGTVSDDKQMDEQLDGVQCAGCALGAVLYATIQRANNLTVGDLRRNISSDPVFKIERDNLHLGPAPAMFTDYLGRYFSQEQLGLIEAAFEKGRGWFTSLGRHWKFDFAIKGPRERIEIIMNNIIKNKGEFVVDELSVKE